MNSNRNVRTLSIRWNAPSRRLGIAVACGVAVLACLKAVEAAPTTVLVEQNANEQSGFTLDFGFPGGVSAAGVSDTRFELSVDPAAGTARIETYAQTIEPIILPGDISTGDITVEVVGSLGGSFNRETGEFVTNDVYAVHFTGNLEAYGIVSPFVLPSSSRGFVTFSSVASGETRQEWSGTSELPNPISPDEPLVFTYTCSVHGVFVSNSESVYVAESFPRHGSLDAGQPHPVRDPLNPAGWDFVEVRFNTTPDGPIAIEDFVVSEWGDDYVAPQIVDAVVVADDTMRLTLDRPIDPGAWTSILHGPSGTSICLAYLPGDVNGDGTTAPNDVLALIDCLNGVGTDCALNNTDIDRSGRTTPMDILREVDLLNGAAGFGNWNGATLGSSPCGQ